MPGAATLMPTRSFSPPDGGLPHLPAAYSILAAQQQQQQQPQTASGGVVRLQMLIRLISLAGGCIRIAVFMPASLQNMGVLAGT